MNTKAIDSILAQAKKQGAKALSEFESLRLLDAAGIPVAGHKFVSTGDEAVEAAESIGFPVVVKGAGRELLHKTELGIVFLNQVDKKQVAEATREIAQRAGSGLEGFIVAEMISGERELIAGFLRDSNFGPSVMFGLGGIAAEALGDAVFRLAPLSVAEASEMITEIRGRKLLGPFRGMPEVDISSLAEAIVALGELGSSREIIKEIDVNPLIVSGSKAVAADALIVLNNNE